MNTSNKINTYDGSGYLTNSLDQTWTGSSWVNAFQTIYTNNPNGSVNFWISQIWNGSAWNNTQRLTYTYNGSGKILTLLAEQFTAGNWVSQTMISYTYDGSGYLTNELSQQWDAGSSSWKDNSRTTYTNNPDGTANQSVSQSWDGSVWNNIERFTFSYSQPTAVSEFTNEADFTVYPNPAHDIITIKANSSFNGTHYSFTDQAGKLVLKGILTNENTSIDITSLAVGVYFLKIGERNQQTFKVIKTE